MECGRRSSVRSTVLKSIAASLLFTLALMQPLLNAAAVAPPPDTPILVIDAGSHTGAINRIAADSACSLLATASDDKTVRIWSVGDPVGDGEAGGFTLVRTLRPAFTASTGPLFAVALSPDGRLVATAGLTGAGEKEWFGFVFDTITGSMVKLLGPLPQQVLRFSFSRDGKYLAATLKNGEGLRVWKTSDWSVVLADNSYGNYTYGLTFDGSGGIFTASYDGFIRHYNSEFKLDAKYSAQAGPKPFSVAVNPETGALAVGFQSLNVLGVFEQPDSGHPLLAHKLEAAEGTLRSVAWAAGGQSLLGAGQYAQSGKYLVRSWNKGAWDAGRDIDIANGDQVMDLIPCGNSLAFTTEGGTFGIFDTAGKRTRFQGRGAIDMRQTKGKSFTISKDGLRVRFGLNGNGENPVIFDVLREKLDASAANPVALTEADTSSLDIKNWNGGQAPTLAGKPIELKGSERALSAAVSPSKTYLYFGSDYYLRKFDASAKRLLELDIGAASPWGLNPAKDGRLIVAAAEDGTIRWYRQDNLKEVVILFVQPQDGRWILWTPQGYYLASRGGEDLIGWQLNRGWSKGADFFPATKFRTRFYRPDIVRLAFQLADAEKAIEKANRKGGVQTSPRDLRAALPPVLNIIGPMQGAPFASKTVRFTYEVRSPTGGAVTKVRALIDGEEPSAKGFVPVANQAWAPDKNVRGSLDLDLPERDVTVTLIADSANGSSEKKSVRLHWTAAKMPSPASLPVLKALIAGINDYKAQSLHLNWAVSDAEELGATLKREEGRTYSKVEVQIIPDATRASLERTIGWLRQAPAQEPAAGTIRILYLSGHGTDANRRFYFLTSDADIGDIEATAVSDSDITGWMRHVPGKKVIFLDACHSANGLELPAGLAFPDYNKLSNDVRAEDEGTVVYASSGRNEFSYESPEWGHGAFTKVLLDGLKGGADPYHTGEIQTSALGLHLEVNVKQLTEGRQTPIWFPSQLAPSFPLAKDP